MSERWAGSAATGVFCRAGCHVAQDSGCDPYDSPADCLAAGLRPCPECDPMDERINGFDAGLDGALARLAVVRAGPVALHAALLPTPLGDLLAICDAHAVRLLEFTSRPVLVRQVRALERAVKGRIVAGRTTGTAQLEIALSRYFAGDFEGAEVALSPIGTPFQQRVWQELRSLPAGVTIRYVDLAARIGRPEAVRAVAAANGANPVAILIPCHRIIGSDGSLTGYGGGLWRKRHLLMLESAPAVSGESLDAGRFSA
ncbi:UNVERIFIED_CONTAM: ogt [Trichonephila clavipes]